MEDKKLISVIVPCYNEQEVLPMFYKEIIRVSADMQAQFPETEFEYLFIDDGSKDRTLKTLRALARHDKRVRGSFLRRSAASRKRAFMPVFPMQRAITASSWMRISSIRLRFCRKCMKQSAADSMTVPPRAESAARANPGYAPGLQGCSTRS